MRKNRSQPEVRDSNRKDLKGRKSIPAYSHSKLKQMQHLCSQPFFPGGSEAIHGIERAEGGGLREKALWLTILSKAVLWEKMRRYKIKLQGPLLYIALALQTREWSLPRLGESPGMPH